MIFVVYLWLYILLVAGVLLYVVARWTAAGRFTTGCRAAVHGLVASLAGLILPFVLFLLAGRILYGHPPPYGGNGGTGEALLALLLLLGPLIGPPAAFLWAAWRCIRRRSA